MDENNRAKTLAIMNFYNEIKEKLKKTDLKIFVGIFILMMIGIVFIFSALMYSDQGVSEAYSYVKRQLVSIGLGTALMVVMICIPQEIYRNIHFIQFTTMIITVSVIYTAFFGQESGGSQNWIRLGPISLQPAEFSKIALALLVSWHATYSYIQRTGFTSGYWQQGRFIFQKNSVVFRSLVLIVITLWMLVIMPDYGMIFIIGPMIILILVMNWAPVWGTFAMYGGALGAYFLLRDLADSHGPDWIASQNYRAIRLGIFVNPFIDPYNAGYQLIQAMLAFSRGGWFGRGLGKGITKQSMPAAHTDFIFAVIGEEVGWLGIIILVMFIYGFFIYLYIIVKGFKDTYRCNVGIALVTIFMIQTTINIGGALSIIPLTGVTLPFISYGGTSILVSMATIGIIQAMIMQEKEEVGGDMENGI